MRIHAQEHENRLVHTIEWQHMQKNKRKTFEQTRANIRMAAHAKTHARILQVLTWHPTVYRSD
jgi:hypothetical protein